VDETQVFSFKAGQFLTLVLDNRLTPLFKSFSIASAPIKLPEIEIAFHLSDDEFTRKILACKVGDEISCLQPNGQLVLKNESSNRHLIFISMGSGVTPLLSIIRQLIYNNSQNRIHLIQTNKTEEKTYFLNELNEIAKTHKSFHLLNVLTNTSNDRLDFKKLTSYFNENKIAFSECEYFISGSGEFVEHFASELRKKNIQDDSINIEQYDYSEIKKKVEKSLNKIKLP